MTFDLILRDAHGEPLSREGMQRERDEARGRGDAAERALSATRGQLDQAHIAISQLRGELEKLAERVDRDRREPDKLLCHTQSARSALLRIEPPLSVGRSAREEGTHGADR